MKKDLKQKKGKAWVLLLLPWLAAAGVSVVSLGDGGEKPGSDVLGIRVEAPSGVSKGKKPNTGSPSGETGGSDTQSGGSVAGGSGSGSGASEDSFSSADDGPTGPLPLVPVITAAPDDVTFSVEAHFRFTGEPGVKFQCQLDSRKTACNKGSIDYKKLDTTDHVFRVWAVNDAGRSADFDEHRWTILIKRDFGISGDAEDTLHPGATTNLDLRISNPFSFAIRVETLVVSVEDDPICLASNLKVIPVVFSESVVVPRNSVVSLSQFLPDEDLPKLQMLNTGDNQDSCKNFQFELNYEGTATKA